MQTFTRFLSLFCVLFLALSAANAQPLANFTSNVVQGCNPLVVQFTSTSTGNPTSYAWNLGNSVTSSQPNPSTTYTNPGTYTVTLTVSNAAGSNTKTVTNYITVHPSPTVNFTGTPLAGCPGTVVNFTDQSNPNLPGAVTYFWNFGDGNSATTQNSSNAFYVNGNYNVSLKVTNSQGCVTTVTKPNYVLIHLKPIADFTASNTAPCFPPANVTFTSNIIGIGAPYTYAWTFGDLGTSNAANPPHTYTTSNSFTVGLVVTDGNGCKDTMVKPTYVNVGMLNPSFTYPAAGVCPFDTAFFINTTVPAPAYTVWDFGDGNSLTTIDNAYHVYTAAGTYNVKMVVHNGPCKDSVTHQVVVHPFPDASFTYTPSPPCPAPVNIQFSNATTGATSYNWTFGDYTSSGVASPNHTYTTDSAFIATLVAISNFGCKDTVRDTIYFYDIDLGAFSLPGHGCAPVTTTFDYHTTAQSYPTWYVPYPFPYVPMIGAAPFFYDPQPFGIASFSWDFGDGSPTSTLPNPTHTYPNPGTYHPVLTIVTNNGCVITDTTVVSVGTPPTPSFYATPNIGCMNTPFHFINTSTNVYPYTNYIWDFGGGAVGSVSHSPTVTFSMPGVWTVTLHASNNGCQDSFKLTNYITANAPKAVIQFEHSCDTPTLVRFANGSIGDSSNVWIFGDGGTSTIDSPHHQYPGLNNYTVTLATYNPTTGCRDTTTTPVWLLDPKPTFFSSDTAICKNDTIILSIPDSTNIAALHKWKIESTNTLFIDTTSNFNFFPHGFGDVDYYTITLYYYDYHGCYDSVKKVNYQLVSKPTVNFGGDPILGCTPMTVQFQDSSWYITGTYPSTRLWTFGDSPVPLGGNLGNPTHTYYDAGLYDVKLIVTDNVGCTDSFKRIGYIEARHPEADYVADDSAACIGQVITFLNNSASPVPLTYEWDFGDNTPTSGATSPTHAYAATGVYTVRLIAIDATGCRDTMVRTNYIHITKPDASFTMSDTFSICPPLLVQFTNTSTGATGYNWTFGNGTSTVPSPSNIYNIAGQFDIMLIAQDAEGCTDTAYGHAEVLGYAGALTYTPLTGCAPLTVNFTALINNVPSLIWDFSDGSTQVATSTTISHVYTTKGAYVPKLIISDGAGCLTSSLGLDTIKVDGVDAAFTYVHPACIGSPVQFNDVSTSLFSPMVSWNWTFSPTDVQGFQNPTYTYNATGTYSVTLVGTNAQGCKDTVTGTVDVLPLPIIDAGLDTVICKGDAATLLPSGGVSYTWGPAGTLSCTACTNPQASPGVPTVYTVTGKDAAGCANRDSVRVTLQIKTTSATNANAEVCNGSGVMLTGTGAHRYEWSPAATLNNSQVPNPVAMPFQNTTYMMVAWEGSCTPDTHYVHVVVHPKPKVNAGPDQTLVNGSSTKLQGSGAGIAKYFWLNDGTLSCDSCSNPTASPIATTTYTLSGYTDHGCADSDRVTVHVICDQSQVFIPNTFTPNGDGHNDYFYPRGKGIDQVKTMRIYNRWGQPVYEKTNFGVNDKTLGWDGTLKGQYLSPDVYVYIIEATCENGEPISFKGDVTLMR